MPPSEQRSKVLNLTATLLGVAVSIACVTGCAPLDLAQAALVDEAPYAAIATDDDVPREEIVESDVSRDHESTVIVQVAAEITIDGEAGSVREFPIDELPAPLDRQSQVRPENVSPIFLDAPDHQVTSSEGKTQTSQDSTVQEHVDAGQDTNAKQNGDAQPGSHSLPPTAAPLQEWGQSTDAAQAYDTVQQYTVQQYTVAQIVAQATASHPSVHAASRQIDVARAGITTASTKENPNFVLDFDTPVHDRNDASELQSRITFPFGKSKERHWRRRVAFAQVIKAEATFQLTLRRVADEAAAAALRSIYLQQRLELEREEERLAKERQAVVNENLVSEDPGRNVMARVDARVDSDRATKLRFITQRELAAAHAMVTSAMGSSLQDHPLFVVGSLEQTSLDLPPLEEILALSEQDSERVIVALAGLNESRAFHSLQKNIRTDKEFGPRYQDRLGRDDDSFGLRLDMDLNIHQFQRGPIAQSSMETRQQHELVALARHEWMAEVTRIYRELQTLADEITHYQSDQFIADQISLLEDEATSQLMTAAQRIEVQQAILQRRQDQLRRLYEFAVLRSQIQLGLGIE